MIALFPFISISLAILVYIAMALLASILIKKAGEDLKSMKSSISNITIIIGAAGNFCVLGIILLFLILLNNRSINSLGLSFNFEGLIFSAALLIILLITIYGTRINTVYGIKVIYKKINKRRKQK